MRVAFFQIRIFSEYTTFLSPRVENGRWSEFIAIFLFIEKYLLKSREMLWCLRKLFKAIEPQWLDYGAAAFVVSAKRLSVVQCKS